MKNKLQFNYFSEAIDGVYYFADINVFSGQLNYREAKVDIIAESFPSKYYMIRLKESIKRHSKGDIMRVLEKNVRSSLDIAKRNKTLLPYWLEL